LAADLGMYVGPSSEKKRDGKASNKIQEQMEKESVKSGASKIGRSTNGRFEGGKIFGEHKFVMKGLSKGKQ